MTPTDIQRAFEERAQAVHALRELATEADGREFTAEETEVYERQNTAIDALDSRIKTGLDVMDREAKAVEALEEFRSYNALTTPTEVADKPKSDMDQFRSLLNGEIRSFESIGEYRDLTKGSATAGGNIVTDILYDRVVEKFTEEGVAFVPEPRCSRRPVARTCSSRR